MVSGDPAHFLAAGSSIEWNLYDASPPYASRYSTSPERTPTNTYDFGTSADPASPWVYPLVYEFQVDKAAFGASGFCEIDITEVHNSPLKSGVNPSPTPVLNGVKEADPVSGTEVDRDDSLLYTLTFSNTGLVDLADTFITDVVDPNLVDVVPLDGGTCDTSPCSAGSTLSWDVGTFAAGTTVSVTFTAVVEWTGVDGDFVYNGAVLDSSDLPEPFETNVTEHPCFDFDGDGVCAADNCPDDYNPDQADSDSNGQGDACSNPLLNLSKVATGYTDADGDGVLSPGDTVHYQLDYSNDGSGTANNTVLTDDPDETYVSGISNVSGGGTYDGDTITWSIGGVSTGAGGTLTYDATLGGPGAFPAGTTSVPNTASLTSDEDGPVNASESVDVVAGPLLGLTKTATGYFDTDSDGTLSPGDTVVYELAWDNSGNADATGAVLVDDPDETYVASVANISDLGSYDGDTISWSLGTLPSGASGTVSYEVTFSGPDTFLDGTTAVPNTSVLTSNEEGPVTADETVHVAATADIAIAKSVTGTTDNDGDGQLSPGDDVHYSLTWSSIGNAAATGAILTDDPDEAYVAGISAISGGGSYDGNQISWSLGTLSSGTSGTLTYTATLAAAGSFGDGDTNVLNTAILSAAEAGPATDTASVVVTAAAELTLAKASTGYTDADGDGQLSPGDTVHYQLDYANVGNAGASGALLTDDPDETYVGGISAISGGGSYDGNTIVWALGNLAAGGSGSVGYDAQMGSVGTFAHGDTAVTNTASLISLEDGPVTDIETVTVTAAASLSVSKLAVGSVDNDGNGVLSPGDTVSYAVSYQNDGNAAATGVTLSDDPDELYVAGISAVSDGGLYDGDTLSWSLGSLAAGEVGTVTYDATLLGAGAFSDGTTTVANTAILDSGEDGPVTSTETVDVIAGAALSVTKASTGYTDADGDGQLSPGDTVQYSVTYANDGDADATNGLLTDDPDETYVAGIGTISAGGTYDGDLISWSVGTIVAGGSGTVTYQATLGGPGTFADGATLVSNTVSLQSDEDGPVSATETVTVIAAAALSVSKTATGFTDSDGDGQLSPGDTVQYAVTYANDGNAAATSVSLGDDPDELYVAGLGAISDGGLYDGDVIAWSLGTLASGETGTVTYEATLGGAGTFAHGTTDVGNTATLSSSEDGPVSASETVTVAASAVISVAKASTGYSDTDGDGVLSPGDTVSYQVDYSNSGNAAATGVALSDDPDESYVAGIGAISDGGTYDGDTIAWSLGTVAASGSGSVTYTATLLGANSFADGTTAVNNTATLSSNEDGPVSDVETVTVEASAALTLSKTSTGYTDSDGNGVLSPGDSVLYAVTYANAGNAPASNASVSDDPDEHYVAGIGLISDGGTYDGATIAWSLGTVDAGTGGTLTYEATLLGANSFADGVTTVNNTAVVDSDETDPVGDTETVDVTADAALSLVKAITSTTDVDGDGQLSPGDVVSYTLSYANDGDAAANNAVLTDDPDEAYVAGIGNISGGGSYNGDVTTWSLGTIPAGGGGSVSYDATLGGAGTFPHGTTDVINLADLQSDEDGPVSDSATVTVIAAADVTLAKASTGYTDADGDGVLSPGDSVQYALTYSNAGNATANNLSLGDDPDEAWVTGLSSISDGGSYDGDTIAWSLGSLAAGASGTLTYTAALAGAGTFPHGGTPVGNTAVLTSDEDGPETASETVTVQATALLAVVKALVSAESVASTFDNLATAASDEGATATSNTVSTSVTVTTRLTWALDVSNPGNATATNVTLSEVLPAGTTLASATGSYIQAGADVTWSLGDLAPGDSTQVLLTALTD